MGLVKGRALRQFLAYLIVLAQVVNPISEGAAGVRNVHPAVAGIVRDLLARKVRMLLPEHSPQFSLCSNHCLTCR